MGKQKLHSPPDDIVLVKDKDGYYTKHIYRNGWRMVTYRGCPYDITFKSPMINDDNQDLCNGWTRRSWIPEGGCEADIIVDRVLQGLKPMGIIHGWEKYGMTNFYNNWHKLKADSTIVISHTTRTFNNSTMHDLAFCRPGELGHIFDLKALAEDYNKQGLDTAFEEILQALKKGTRIEEYLVDYDNHDWLTGLILGYPIENTISACYYEQAY
jgi:hypothetical protein